MLLRRRTCFASALVAIFCFALAQGALGAEKKIVKSTTSPEPGSLRFRLTADPATLDWNLARSSHETYVIMNIMEGLVEEGPDLKPEAGLAESWELSEDKKTYVFQLRKGVKWSDGKIMAASDFVDSWIRLLNPDTKSPYASFLFDVENAEAFNRGRNKSAQAVGVRALSADRLQVKLKAPAPHFLHLLSFWVTFPIRADLIAKNGANWALPGRIATLGPYRLEEWKKGKGLVLRRNPTYFKHVKLPAGVPEKVEAIIEQDDQEARRLFQEGKLDFLLDATTGDLLKAKAQADGSGLRARVEQFPYLATYYLAFNTKLGALKDPQIRRALAVAVDRDAIPATLQGGQLAAKGWIPPGIVEHETGVVFKGNLHEARATLAKAGFPEGHGFPPLSLWMEKFDGAEALAAMLERSFREKLGVEVQVIFSTPAEFQKAMRNGKVGLFLAHWGADFADASNFFKVFTTGSGMNGTGWTNAEYDQWVEKASRNSNVAERLSQYVAAERILIERDMVLLPLFYRRNTVLLGKRIKGLSISPLNYLFIKNVTLSGS